MSNNSTSRRSFRDLFGQRMLCRLSGLLTLCWFTVAAQALYAQNPVISLTLKNATVREVIEAVKTQSGYSFWYRESEIDLRKRVSVEAHDQNVLKLLDGVLADQGILAKLEGRHIVLYKSDPAGRGREYQLKGRVETEAGDPIVGANVLVEGTTNGMVTNSKGEFALRIGHHAVRRALDQHVRPHDRIAGLGLDAALQLVFPAPACRVGFVKHDVAAFEFGQNSLVGEHAVEQFQDVLIVRLDRNALPEVDLALPIPERVAALRLDRFDHLAHGGVLQRQRNHGILRVKSLGRHREPTQGQQSAQSAQHPLAEKVPEGPSAGRIVTHKD